jgi:RNase P subunit RPR2
MALTVARLDSNRDRSYLIGIRSTQSEAMAVKRKPVLKVICPDCKIPMQQRDDKAPVIQLSTGLKWVVFTCPECGVETERRMAV